MGFYDIAYAVGLGISAPVWLLIPRARRKVFEAFRLRSAREPGRQTSHPAIMIHAVSVGELNATPAMVHMLAELRPELRFIISTTTRTGWDRLHELYGNDPKVSLIRYPLDFSGPVSRLLDAQRPTAVVLMELEVWPNLVRACAKQEIPVIVVNGRLTRSSYRNYKLGWLITRRMFRRVSMVCAQDETYARRFVGVGVLPDRVRVTGTMKFDTAQIAASIPGAESIAASVGLRPGAEPIWVCGSTGPGEERIVLEAYSGLLESHSTLRLVIVPRKPERFDEVAELICAQGFPLARRSEAKAGTKPQARAPLQQQPVATAPIESPEGAAATAPLVARPPVVLGDTMGELRAFYSIANVVFVGRTLVDLGPRQRGSDMIEPAALAKPVIVGTHTDNFAEAVNRLRDADAIREVRPARETDAAQLLRSAVAEMLADASNGAAMGRRAQDVVRKNQGATARNVEAILTFLPVARRQPADTMIRA